MRKNIFILGLAAITLSAASCSNDNKVVDPDTMPEGTADVTINETDANYAEYATNWCNYAAAVSSKPTTSPLQAMCFE